MDSGSEYGNDDRKGKKPMGSKKVTTPENISDPAVDTAQRPAESQNNTPSRIPIAVVKATVKEAPAEVPVKPAVAKKPLAGGSVVAPTQGSSKNSSRKKGAGK